MAKTIFDISKKLRLDAHVVLTKAKELGITVAKVTNSRVDDITAEWLEEELLKTNKPEKGGSDSSIYKSMKPCLDGRRLVEVPAGISWTATLKHRVYSCPDTPEYDYIAGATALILRKGETGIKVPLEVCTVVKLKKNRTEDLRGLSPQFRDRAEAYLAEVSNNPRIIRTGCAHRLYFLGTEPWPVKMQKATASTSATEWTAILSICAEPGQFFRWPQTGRLFWKGCIRPENDGEHSFPNDCLNLLHGLGLTPDTRTNGPSINSFQAAGGERPRWNNEGWHIHHVFDGTEGSPHAVKDGDLFTHSAGLVAAHPVAHDFAHRSILLKWLLRREAYLRFGLDPKGDFADA